MSTKFFTVAMVNESTNDYMITTIIQTKQRDFRADVTTPDGECAHVTQDELTFSGEWKLRMFADADYQKSRTQARNWASVYVTGVP